jgi:Tfp pilus assembly protein PilO
LDWCINYRYNKNEVLLRHSDKLIMLLLIVSIVVEMIYLFFLSAQWNDLSFVWTCEQSR